MKLAMMALVFAALLATPGGAQEPKPAGETKLTLGGVWVLQIRVAAGGYSPEQRLSTLQDRVVQMLSRPELRPADVRVVPGPGEKSAAIWVGYLMLVTVTQADATASRSTPVKLANVWAENFRRAFRAARPRPIPPQPAPSAPQSPG